MTIRDYLKRRRNRAVLFVLPGIVFCASSDEPMEETVGFERTNRNY